MKTKTLAGVLAVCALVLGLFALPHAAVSDTTLPSNDTLVIGGCVIRFDTLDGAGNVVPRIHENEAHDCRRVDSLEVLSNGQLRVHLDDALPIVSLVTQSDETMIQKGVTCGASGGREVVNLTCYDRTGTKVRADDPAMYSPVSNLWFTIISSTQDE